MLSPFLEQQAHLWFSRTDCPVASVVAHMQSAGFLRDAQIEALKTYLFLKIEGQNKPLARLFAEGFFAPTLDLSRLPLSETARAHLQNNRAARSFYEWAAFRAPGQNKAAFPELESFLQSHIESVDAEKAALEIFGGVSYPDFLFSLPMGAGKSYLMAAILYLDLYFSIQEPENPIWARNFLLLVPSGLKTSILPSLKTIEHFNPAHVVPEPAASQLKSLLRFELLDQPKSGARSNRARNPNAQKVASHQPFENLSGLVLVTNAEKVILDRVALSAQGVLWEESDDERDKAANELRNLIGKIPALQILIDEVHHAATDDIKLRQVVGKWNKTGHVNGVLGFSGTPYLSSPETISLGGENGAPGAKIKFAQISNTVFYYPLLRAIQTFLKKPRVKALSGLESLDIVRRGVSEFRQQWGDTVYPDGTRAKLAIYCGTIERLETQILPLLTGELGIARQQILAFHKGNKDFPLDKTAPAQFAALDSPLSPIRFVLLVQIGKEGWDCRSLAGVVLSQKGDCPTNMVLQTSCRCLRQVSLKNTETAGIWLNAENARELDKQLKSEQNTSIAEINNLSAPAPVAMRERFGRLEQLALPPLDFYQMQIQLQTRGDDLAPASQQTLEELAQSAEKTTALEIERGLHSAQITAQSVVQNVRGEPTNFHSWLLEISKGGFGFPDLGTLETHAGALRTLWERITIGEGEARFWNTLYARETLESQIRRAFHPTRTLQTSQEIVPQSALLLLVEKLAPIAANKTLFPGESDAAKIRELDESGISNAQFLEKNRADWEIARAQLEKLGMAHMMGPLETELSFGARARERSLHFLPYDFSQSKFELAFLENALALDELAKRNLELYFNGESHLTQFRIMCHEKRGAHWARVGLYTPDFLLMQRENGTLGKVLIIETKGTGFGEQLEFQKRRAWVEGEWLRFNNQKFGFQKFDFLFLSDGDPMPKNLSKLCDAMNQFFGEV